MKAFVHQREDFYFEGIVEISGRRYIFLNEVNVTSDGGVKFCQAGVLQAGAAYPTDKHTEVEIDDATASDFIGTVDKAYASITPAEFLGNRAEHSASRETFREAALKGKELFSAYNKRMRDIPEHVMPAI